ncbi:MAG: hypothetical protein IJ643_09360 [Eubacterium sp.]|nr:hypothetical protein [Eubacterium sp.]
MKKTLFKIMITALSIVLIIAAMPYTALAEAVPLGEESPFIKTQFLDSNDEEVDGNSLAAGQTYTVNFVLSDISSVAIFNMTANYTDDINITQVSSIADVENSGFEYGGYKKDEDNNAFVIVISTVNNTTYTELDGETVMVTLTVEVNTDGDFADFFDLSTDRNHTFIIANLEEGNEPAYVYKDLEQTTTDYPFLDYDMSPSSSVTVTGAVKVSKDVSGDTYEAYSYVAGATVDAVDAQGNVLATTTTDSEGKFSIAAPSDAVAITIVKYCVPERRVALSGSEVSDYPVIPVVAIDYDSSGTFNAPDKAAFNTKFAEKDADSDLDGSGTPNTGDKGVLTQFNIGARFGAYSEMTL